MQWQLPPITAKLLKRYKRFFADVELDGKVEIAHVPNTGSLKTALEPGQLCLITPAADRERKLRFTLEAVQVASGTWVGVNTSWPNKLAKEAFEKKLIPHWQNFSELQAEVKISKESRLDLCLVNAKKHSQHYVEIKNVTMKKGDHAQFPDAVSERGQKHLRELMKLTQQGHSSEILFAVQRTDCKYFSPADEIDPAYGKLLRESEKIGVKITAVVVEIGKDQIVMTDRFLEVKL